MDNPDNVSEDPECGHSTGNSSSNLVICPIFLTPQVAQSIPNTVANSNFLQASSSQDRLALLGKLAACTAHDLNNLITIIQIHASNVEDESTSPPDRIESGKQISSICRRCADLVRRTLLFSKGRADTFTTVAVDELLPELTAFTEPLLRRSPRWIYTSRRGWT